MHRTVEDESLSGRIVVLEGHELRHFGSCSYLGLELDARLREGAIEALARYGTQFSSSRAYLSSPPYADLEDLFERIFEAPTLLAPTTTLGHLSALPTLLEDTDVAIYDQQVHHSVQMALNQARLQGTATEILRHNRLDVLEERIKTLRKRHKRVWYLADGVYSMYGDLAPVAELYRLLDAYDEFHVYIDDAHGMSWRGENGRGHVLDGRAIHPRMVVATSLAKGFGVGGGVLVFPNAEWKRLVRTCGGPMIFSGPIQPPSLGAALASARLHLTDEIRTLQAQLSERLQYCNQLLNAHGLPLVSQDEVPIRFVGMGQPRVAFNMVRRLMQAGYYANVSMFPAVPMKRAGVRFTITNHHTREDIRGLVETMAACLPEVLAEEQTSLEQIRKTFDLPAVGRVATPAASTRPTLEISVRAASPMRLEHQTSIQALDRAEWNRLMGGRGVFDWDGLRMLEETFSNQPQPENNWRFHYYMVRGEAGVPVLATFFTEALWKDDLLEKSSVSRAVEARRAQDPSFLVSRVLGMGSPLSEGNHLYLDRRQDWREAMRLLLRAVRDEQEQSGATSLVLRDLAADDAEMAEWMRREGFVRTEMPEAFVAELIWADEDALIQSLSRNSRRHQAHAVQPWSGAYEIEVVDGDSRRLSPEEIAHLHGLYREVKGHNLALNTFELPADFFAQASRSPGWELLLFRPRGASHELPVGFVASYAGEDHYVPLVAGLDYTHVHSAGLYRQCLRQSLLRAKALGKRQVFLGFGAPLEKSRFGARPVRHVSYLLATDTYQLELLEQVRHEACLA
ncbi:MAG TPA: aminotransferase class I/II-fold pyridoxal phosphate-dependent enzyme [Oscillatoriaceae cyanobacterium]